MKKFFIYSGVILAILVLLYLGVSFWVLRSTYSHVAAKRQAIANSGDALYLTDYESDPVAPEDNAYHYLMLAAADLEKFAADYDVVYEDHTLERRLRPDQIERLAAVVDKYPRLFKLLEQAAACDAYQADVDYADGIMVELDHINLMRNAARALSIKSLVAAYRGEGNTALARCETSLRVSNHLSGEPILISHLVNLACQATAILTANHTLRVADTSPAARQTRDDLLAQIDNQQATIDAFKGERAMGVMTFQQMRDGTLGADDADAAGMGNSRLL